MSKSIATNKKAFRNYTLLEKWECGIALKGGEVKSLRAGEVSFTDSFARIEGHEIFLYNLHISIPQATLGANVEIPTVEGKVKIKIDPGTQPGKILRLRNKGLPDVNGYRRGDLLVSINVWIPKNLTKEESKLIEKFGDSTNFIPAPDRNEKNFFERMRSYFK